MAIVVAGAVDEEEFSLEVFGLVGGGEDADLAVDAFAKFATAR